MQKNRVGNLKQVVEYFNRIESYEQIEKQDLQLT